MIEQIHYYDKLGPEVGCFDVYANVVDHSIGIISIPLGYQDISEVKGAIKRMVQSMLIYEYGWY